MRSETYTHTEMGHTCLSNLNPPAASWSVPGEPRRLVNPGALLSVFFKKFFKLFFFGHCDWTDETNCNYIWDCKHKCRRNTTLHRCDWTKKTNLKHTVSKIVFDRPERSNYVVGRNVFKGYFLSRLWQPMASVFFYTHSHVQSYNQNTFLITVRYSL